MNVIRLLCDAVLMVTVNANGERLIHAPDNNIFGAMLMVTVILCFVEMIKSGIRVC